MNWLQLKKCISCISIFTLGNAQTSRASARGQIFLVPMRTMHRPNRIGNLHKCHSMPKMPRRPHPLHRSTQPGSGLALSGVQVHRNCWFDAETYRNGVQGAGRSRCQFRGGLRGVSDQIPKRVPQEPLSVYVCQTFAVSAVRTKRRISHSWAERRPAEGKGAILPRYIGCGRSAGSGIVEVTR